MTYESTVGKTVRTFLETEVVSNDTHCKVAVLVCLHYSSEKVEVSVESVVESKFVNAPVSPVFDLLDRYRVSVETECYLYVTEFLLNILDE